MSHRKYETMIDVMFHARKELPDLQEPQVKDVDPGTEISVKFP
jgi:hypothetical protein